MSTNLKQVTATGQVVAGPVLLKSVTLTAGSDAASVVIDDSTDGTGTDRLTLKAAANASAVWASPDAEGVYFGTAIHVTLTGTNPAVTVEYE